MLRIFVAGLLSAGLSACQANTQSLPASAQAIVTNEVAALGRLEPKSRVIDVGVSGDERLSRLLVKQGQFVKNGEILAYLEIYATRLAARDRAVALLRDAEAQLGANTEQSRARIHEADLHLEQINDVSAQEIEAQEAHIREIRADLDLALLDLERSRTLRENDVVSIQQFDRQAAQVDHIRASLQSAEATLRKLRVTAETDRRLAEAQIATRRAEMESVRSSAQLASFMQAVNLAEAELKTSVVCAPSDGQIFEILANPGEGVQGRTILRMGDVSEMYVLAEVYESDTSRVRTGQTIEVTSPALSKPLTGVVEFVGTSVSKRQVRSLDPQADADARVVQIRGRLDNSDEAARYVGLQVDLRIRSAK